MKGREILKKSYLGEYTQGQSKLNRTREDMDFLNLSGFKGYIDQGFKGQGVKVAIIDTGVNKDHEILKDKDITMLRTTYYGTGKDDNGHGTHVIGTVLDIAPDVELISYKALDLWGSSTSTESVVNDISEALYDAILRGVDIIGMSIGIPEKHLTLDQINTLHIAIKKAVENEISVIVSAGNTGNYTKMYPASFKEVISVGAIDEWYSPAWFSTMSDEVDMCQIGVNVWSADYKGGYKALSGTSMAQPIVTGLAALLTSKYNAVFNKKISESTLYEMLKTHCVDLNEPGWDSKTGVGFLTFKDAIRTVFYPYNENAMIVNGVKVQIPQGLINVTAENGDIKAVIPIREGSEVHGDSVTWDKNGVTIRH